jgi:hypothetical protein
VFAELLESEIDRRNMCWIKIKTKPTPNSTAESIKNKKVSEVKLTLSNRSPAARVARYKVTHKSSAVRRRCKAVLTFIVILMNSKIKRRITKLKSVINMLYS